MTYDWDRSSIMKFLDLLEKEPIIWDRKNKGPREEIHDAWKRIQIALRKDFPVAELKKKKYMLMNTYRKITRKIKNGIKAEGGVNEVYEPEWFCYDRMASFLDPTYKPKGKAIKNPESEPDIVICDKFGNEIEKPPKGDQVKSADINTTSQEEEATVSKKRKLDPEDKHNVEPYLQSKQKHDLVGKHNVEPYLQLKQKHDPADKHYVEPNPQLKPVSSKPKAPKNETQMFCEILYMKLRALNESKRERAMYEINNLLYNLKHQKPSPPSVAIPYFQQPVYFPGFVQQSPDMNNRQLPNHGFRENSPLNLSSVNASTSE